MQPEFCGANAEGTEPSSLCHLLPMEQQEPMDLPTQGHCFLWLFRVKIAVCVLGESMELLVAVCARQQDSLPGNGAWNCIATSGTGDCEY
jgi:hypothetical protein